jgi:hypothetical protein
MPRTLTPAIQKHLSEIGKKGGSKTSPAKAAAAALNGKKGGRPKKIKLAEAA